ncbi:hypothetical protein Gasu2_48820 [Galdieria sulphuraria]|nr:hypothetical protein Gasu2_48820 [Galdieria sulphuraria]
MDLSKEVRSGNDLQSQRGSEATLASKADSHETNSTQEPDSSSNRADLESRRSLKCPLYCPKPRRVTPSHKFLFISSERTCATLSSLSGSWLTFEDGGSTGDLSDVSRRCENAFASGAGDRQEWESLEWSSSPSPVCYGCGNVQKQCEKYSICMSEVGSLSSSFKSHGFLNAEKSKSSLISECTNSSVNIEDCDFSSMTDERNSEMEFLGSPPVRSENPMVRDSWFRLSTKDLTLEPHARSEMLRRSLMGGRRHRYSTHTSSLLYSMDRSYAHFRPSPALSV